MPDEFETPARGSNAEDLVEGGVVLKEPRPPGFDSARHHAETASRITYVLLAVLALSVALHYGGVMAAYFSDRVEMVEALTDIFKVWIPVLSGFLGSALAYYFTQRRS